MIVVVNLYIYILLTIKKHMKLQKPQNSTPKLKGVIGSARMRPKLNNYTFVDEDIMIYKKSQAESSHQQSQEEHYSALRRLHAQGMT